MSGINVACTLDRAQCALRMPGCGPANMSGIQVHDTLKVELYRKLIENKDPTFEHVELYYGKLALSPPYCYVTVEIEVPGECDNPLIRM